MEKWKDIPGYENIYQASNMGNIRTCAGKVTTSVRHGVRHWEQRVLKQHYCNRKKSGLKDARVTLWKDKEPHYYLVSRLVAMTWCDGYSEGLTVNHIDGNPLNNKAENLEWVSLAENIKKGFESGLYPSHKCLLTGWNGDEKLFYSFAAANRYLGRNDEYISNVMKGTCVATNKRTGEKYYVTCCFKEE